MVIHYRLLLFCVNTALFFSFWVRNFTIINFYTCQTSDCMMREIEGRAWVMDEEEDFHCWVKYKEEVGWHVKYKEEFE